MEIRHKYFSRGRETDGDSNDLPGESMRECINIDYDEDVGLARPRPGLDLLTFLGDVPTIDNAPYIGGDDELPAAPNNGTWMWYDTVLFDSGIETVQSNAVVIVRELANGAWEDQWCVYSNAPNGGNGNLFSLLTPDPLNVPVCNGKAINGQVRFALGPSDDMMIHMNLCEEGDRIMPFLTVTPVTQSSQLPGEGGKIVNGWLWDYSKPYWSKMGGSHYEIADDVDLTWPAAAYPAEGLEECDTLFALVPVYDEYEQQYGVPLVSTVSKGLFSAVSWPVVFEIEIRPSTTTYNKRITGFAVYGQRTNRTDRADDPEPRRLLTISMQNLAVSAVWRITRPMFASPEGVWSADSKGRALSLNMSDAAASTIGSVTGTRLNPSEAHVDDEISVKATTLTIRRKRMYAGGINKDPGQSRFAVSMPDDNSSGQLDVYYKINRIWRDGSRATVWAEEWMDRLFLWNADNSYLIDLEQRLDDQVMTIDVGYGVGTRYPRTIKKGGNALYWANDDGVWRFTGGAPVNLCEDKWMREWRNISSQYKQNAVGGYNARRHHYWLAVQIAFGLWNVYVYSAVSNGWRVYRLLWSDATNQTEFEPQGFFSDEQGRLCVFGSQGGGSRAYVHDYVSALDGGAAVVCLLESQWLGHRNMWHVPDKLRVEWSAGSGQKSLAFSLYANRSETPYHVSMWPPGRTQRARVRVRTVREYKFRLAFRVDPGDLPAQLGAYIPPEVREVAIDTHDVKMRTE